MKNPLRSTNSANLGMLLARLPLGVLFAAAGFMKFSQIGVKNFVNMNIGAATKFMPESLGRAYLYALPTVELLVGVLIAIGWFTRSAGLIASLILISIMMATSGVWNRDIGMPDNNLVLLGLTLMLLLAGPGAIALDNVRISKGGESIK